MVDKRFPSAKEVELFHTNSDKDGSPTSIHHTLGNGPNQAAPGDHVHDGGSSKELDIEDWEPLSLENGWVNYVTGGHALAKISQNTGFVELQGLIKHATTTTTGVITTLPLGYKPTSGIHVFFQPAGAGLARIDVATDGTVAIQNYVAGGSGIWISLVTLRIPLG